MPEYDWADLFDEILDRRPGFTAEAEQRFCEELFAPISATEAAWLSQELKCECDDWALPAVTIPASYLSLLRWSNGGSFRTGRRKWNLFPALDEETGVRVMMLGYGVPEKTPGLLPIAFNGSGVFYGFDTNADAVDGEYPIRAAECGYPNKGTWIAASLWDAVRGKEAIEELWES